MTSVIEEPVIEDRIRIPTVPLKLADRCDGPGLSRHYEGRVAYCGAQAFVRITTNSGELLFCGHHYSQFELAFMTAGFGVDDQRSLINDKPTSTDF